MYLGIDVGSTATKAVAFDASGTPLAAASAEYEIARPEHDRAEQDSREWLAAVQDAVSRVASRVDLTAVRGIGVTGQVDTHVLVDSDLRPLAPALLWQDVRSVAEAEALNERLGAQGRRAGWGDEGLRERVAHRLSRE